MKIAVIGSGYVGLTAAVSFAKLGHQVICIDIDAKRVEMLKAGKSPIFEEGLEAELKAGLKASRLEFAASMKNRLADVQVVFIAVGTPSNADGSVHINSVQEVATAVGASLNTDQIIVIKSTVPVGTCDSLKQKLPHLEFVSNPEFLREGVALQDFLNPQRIIVGSRSERATLVLKELYAPIIDDTKKFIVMDPCSAEMSKYAANAMLAARISLMNEMSQLCEKLGADIQLVKEGIGSDSRIGKEFLNAGVGFGGSCLPKDINAIIDMGAVHNIEVPLVKAVRTANENQKSHFAKKVIEYFEGIKNIEVAVWGLSFKPGTDDVREAPSLEIIETFLRQGFHVRVYDPAAMSVFKEYFRPSDKITYAADPMAALKQSDVLCVLTEWPEFKKVDPQDLKAAMKNPLVFDGRNIFDSLQMKRHGIEYFSVGRPS